MVSLLMLGEKRYTMFLALPYLLLYGTQVESCNNGGYFNMNCDVPFCTQLELGAPNKVLK